MKFGKKIRTELSPSQLRGSVNYKALKKIAKTLRRTGAGSPVGGTGGRLNPHNLQRHHRHQQLHHHHHPHPQEQLEKEQQQEQGIEGFFARVEVEKEKVAEFYRSREAWCFLALESTRGALFGLTRRASKDRLCIAAQGPAAAAAGGAGGSGNGGGGGGGQTLAALEKTAAGELEGKFLEAKAGATVLLSESRDLVQFVDMNMLGFRKLLKKLDKWTGGVNGREYFTSLVQTQPWIKGDRAHGVLRMASAMSDHLRSLRPALALGPAAGGPCWADRIVYSVGTFDRPQLPSEPNTASRGGGGGDEGGAVTMMSISPPASREATSPTISGDPGGRRGGRHGWEAEGLSSVGGNGAGAAQPPSPPGSTEGEDIARSGEGPSPLRFLREFGAVVVVGVYTDAAHAAAHRSGGSDGGCGGRGLAGGSRGEGFRPSESLEARCARVRPHADRVVLVDSADPTRVRDVLFGAAAGAVGTGAPTNNCCFVVSDWGERAPGGGTEAGRRARKGIRALMEASMPVFRLPSPSWECAISGGDGMEEEEGVGEGSGGGGGGGAGGRAARVAA